MAENKLNIHRFGEALARALTVHYSKKYPDSDIKITLGSIRERKDYEADEPNIRIHRG